MAFWADNDIEPKRQFRFKVTFGNLGGSSGGGEASTFLAQYADRPSYTVKGDTAVHFMDKQYMFPGKVTWNQVKIRFVDATVGSLNVAKRSYEFLQGQGWFPAKGGTGLTGTPATGLQTVGKIKATTAVGEVSIQTLNPGGGVEDNWILKNPFISNVALSNFDYAQDGILTAEYTFVYDWAEFSV